MYRINKKERPKKRIITRDYNCCCVVDLSEINLCSAISTIRCEEYQKKEKKAASSFIPVYQPLPREMSCLMLFYYHRIAVLYLSKIKYKPIFLLMYSAK